MTDWKVGDRAVCIESSRLTKEGCIYTVSEVWLPGAFRDLGLNPYPFALLSFEEIGRLFWAGSDENRFRKVQHDKAEACETAFTVLLNRSKRKADA